MKTLLGKKSMVAAFVAIAILAASAAAAFAAPVLQPGTTSAPGMSGTCTDCHTYATAAAPAAKPKVLMPSHPYLAKSKNKLGRAFGVWGFIPPKLCGTTNATATITVSRYAHSKWTSVPSLSTTATLSTTGHFKNKTNYATKLTVNRGGSYRMRVRLVYLDSKGVQHTKLSTWKKFSIRK